MTLPNQLVPSPVLTSTVEIRFKSTVDKSKILPLMIANFYEILPNFSETGIPNEVKEANEQLKFYPDYVLKNEDFSISFSDKAISFENINGYKLWDNYFSFIKSVLLKIFEIKIIESVDRIGIRYSSIFELKGNKIEEILNSIPKLFLDNYEGDFFTFSTNIFVDKYRLYLQLNSNNTITKENDETISGLHIDIDASYSDELVNITSFEPVCGIINDLHTHEKSLFFSLIKLSFLEREFQIN